MKILLVIFSIIFAFQPEKAIDQQQTDLPKAVSTEIFKKFKIKNFHATLLLSSANQPDNTKSKAGFYILKSNETELGYLYFGRVNTCRNGGCENPAFFDATASSEFFDYMILFDNHKTVVSVAVYNYEATHGQEITAKGWLKQFFGYQNGQKLEAGKSIDAISGATISVEAIVNDIKIHTALLSTI